jgi:hypothetical protein
MSARVIFLQPLAPAKPAVGEPCNGCGVCCSLEPCPIGSLANLAIGGPCRSLVWHEDARRYRCGVVDAAARAGPWASRMTRRWIGADSGCDAALETAPAPP